MYTLLLILLCYAPPSSSPASQPAELHPGDSGYRHAYVVHGRIEAPRLTESSGLVASRKHPGVYWTLNDSGNAPALFAIDEFGRDLAEWPVDGARNNDWEDIATDDDGHLIVADTGDSRSHRVPQKLLFIDEPNDPRARGRLRVRREISFRLPEGSRDCEALIHENGRYHLIDKRGSHRHISRHPATLYRIIDEPGSSRMSAGEPLEHFDFNGSVTAAALSRDGKRLAVLTYSAVFVFMRTPGGPFFAGKPVITPIMCAQAEAIAFHHDGSLDLLITCEQRMIFRLPRAWYESGQPFIPMARFHAAPSTQERP